MSGMATRSSASILSIGTRSLGVGTFARSTPARSAICSASRPCISRSRRNICPIEARPVSRERLLGSRTPTKSFTLVLPYWLAHAVNGLARQAQPVLAAESILDPTYPAEGCSSDTNKAWRFWVEAATGSTGSHDANGCSFCRVPDSPGGRPVIGMDILFFIATVFLFITLLDFVVCIVSLARLHGHGDEDLDAGDAFVRAGQTAKRNRKWKSLPFSR